MSCCLHTARTMCVCGVWWGRRWGRIFVSRPIFFFMPNPIFCALETFGRTRGGKKAGRPSQKVSEVCGADRRAAGRQPRKEGTLEAVIVNWCRAAHLSSPVYGCNVAARVGGTLAARKCVSSREQGHTHPSNKRGCRRKEVFNGLWRSLYWREGESTAWMGSVSNFFAFPFSTM